MKVFPKVQCQGIRNFTQQQFLHKGMGLIEISKRKMIILFEDEENSASMFIKEEIQISLKHSRLREKKS